MRQKNKQIIKFILRLLITVSLLFLVIYKMDLSQFGQSINSAKPQYLLIVWMLMILGFWVRSVKMHYILKKQQCYVKHTKIFGASAVTSFYSLIMPGLLSTGAKWYILKQYTGKGSNVLSSMMYNQLTETPVKILLGLAAIMIANPFGLWQISVGCLVIMVSIITGCIVLLSNKEQPRISKFLSLLMQPFPKKIRTKAKTILDQIKVFQNTGLLFHFKMAAVSLVDNMIMILMYIFAAKSAGITVPAIAIVWQSSAVYVLGKLPISVANLGVREFTLVEFLGLYGVEAPAALLMSMIIFSAIIVMAAIGACCQIFWMVKPKDEHY